MSAQPASAQPALSFYTTAEQEAALTAIYEERLAAKEAELRNAPQPRKYTATAYVEKPHVVFTTAADGSPTVYFGNGNEPQPQQQVQGGKRYTIDPRYAEKAAAFLAANPGSTIVFMPSGRYGPTIYWCGSFGSTPFYIDAPSGTRFYAESDTDYDIGCL